MRFGVLGTGVVGKPIAARLAGLGHEVMVGTRDPEETMSRLECIRTARELDALYTAPHGGFSDAEYYYAKANDAWPELDQRQFV